MGFLAGFIARVPCEAAPTLAAAQVRRRLAHRGAGRAVWALRPAGRGSALLMSARTHEEPRFSLAFDGRLTNRTGLRDRLVASGHVPHGDEDADLAIAAWRAWGADMLRRLDGAFAIAVHDAATGAVMLARDRFGERPLLIAAMQRAVAFASELPALLAWPGIERAADPQALSSILAFGHAAAEQSPMAGVRRLRPGHLMMIAADGTISERCWWSPPPGPAAEAAVVPADPAALERAIAAAGRAVLDDRPAQDAPYQDAPYHDAPALALTSGEAGPLLCAALGLLDPGTPSAAWRAAGPTPLPAPDAALVRRLTLLQGAPIEPGVLAPALAAGADGGLLLHPAGLAELLLAHRRYRLFARDLARLREAEGRAGRRRTAGFHEAPVTARDLWHAASGGMAEAERLDITGPALMHALVFAAADGYGVSLEDIDPAVAMAGAARLDLALRLPAREVAAVDVVASLTGVAIACPFLDASLVAALAGLPDAARRWLLPAGAAGAPDLSAWDPMGPALRGFTEDTLLSTACRDRDLFSRGRLEALLRRHATAPDASRALLWSVLGIEVWCQAFLDAAPGAAEPDHEPGDRRPVPALEPA